MKKITVHKLKTPATEEDVRKLKTKDTLYITGIVVTARDMAHKRAIEFLKEGKKLPVNLQGLAIFHCGPIVKKKDDKWVVVSAGPTTSSRMEIYEEAIIRNFKSRVIVGKGGMGKKTRDAMQKYGAVYAAFTGGAAVLAATAIREVKRVEWLDLGMPEALWVLKVKEFGPLIVAIDAHGNNLFEEVKKKVGDVRQKIYENLGVVF